MKLKTALLLGIMLFATQHLDGSIFCLTMVSREPEVGTYQEHPPARTNCYCPCKGPRTSDGSCKACGHKVCPVILSTNRTKIVVASAPARRSLAAVAGEASGEVRGEEGAQMPTKSSSHKNKRHRLTN